MNPYTSRALRSLTAIAVAIALYVTSRWVPGNSASSIPYEWSAGYIDDGGQSKERYFITTIQRQNSLPWLIVAQQFSIHSELRPFKTSMSSATAAVEVNGTEYNEIAGQTIVVLDTEQKLLSRHVSRDQTPAIALLQRNFDDVRLADFASILPEQQSSERTNPPQPRNEVH